MMPQTIVASSPDTSTRRTSPYVGLNPYTADDTDFFFGRDKDTELITANLIAARLTLLYGPSGVGKSSVLQAGVIHGLQARAQTEMEQGEAPAYLVVYFNNWREDPVPALLKAVADALNELFAVELPPPTTLTETLLAWSQFTHTEFLIILDQFEEYFLYHQDAAEESTFERELPRALKAEDLRVNFLLSFREDALARLDRFKGRIPNLFKNILRLKHLNLQAARQAIEEPISQYNKMRAAAAPEMEIEPALVDAVLKEVQVGGVVLGESGRGVVVQEKSDTQVEAPYMQLVLTRLWERERQAGSNVLRLATFEQLGGAEEIVRAHLQKAIDDLSPEQQAIAASVFDRLVTPSGAKIAQTSRDLARYARVPDKELDAVLVQLASGQNRILRPVAPSPEQSDAPRYEIFHDVLSDAILEWRGEYVKKQEVQTAAAREKEEREKSERELKQKQTEETLALERNARARQRRLLIGAVFLFVVAFIASVVAGILFVQAQERERNAAQQERIARSRELASVANGQLGVDPEVSILLAREGTDAAGTDEAVSALRRALSISRVRAILPNDGKPIQHIAYSPDGKWFAFDSAGVVRVFNAADSQSLTTLPASGALIRYLQFSPDSEKLVTYDTAGFIRVWDFKKGERIGEKDLNSFAFAAQFSPDSKSLLLSSDIETALWNFETGAKTRLLTLSHTGAINNVFYSSDGKKVATTGIGGRVLLWDVTTGQQLFELKGHTLSVVDIAFSPDSTQLVTSSDDLTARIWDLQTGNEIAVLNHTAPVTHALFSPDSRFVATASSRTATLWSATTGKLIADLRGHSALITDISFSPNVTQLTTTSLDGTARVWEAFSGNLIAELRGHSDAVNGFASSPDGKRIVTASSDGTARVWDVSRDSSVAKLLSLDAPPQRAVLSHSGNGKFLATASSNGEITLWDLEAQTALLTFKAHMQPIIGLAVSPDDTTLATAGLDSRVVLWDFDWSQKRANARLERTNLAVNALAYSPDGKQLVTVDSDGAVVIRDANTLEPFGAQPPIQQTNLQSVAWSKDGNRMAWGGLNGIVLWDTGTQKPIVTISDQTLSALDIEFSPDRRWLVFGSGDSIARMWNAETGEPLLTLRGHGGPIDAVTFDRESQFIVTGSWDNTARVWETATGSLVKELGGHTEDVTGVFYALKRTTIVTTSQDGTIQLNECEVCVDVGALRELAAKRVTRALACVELRIYFHQTGVGCLPTPTPLVTAIAPPTAAPITATPAFEVTASPVPPSPTVPPTGCITRITGVVFNDEDQSGKRDGKEQGIAGVTVQIFGTVTQTGDAIASATTDASGNYAFSISPSGDYQIVVTNPRNFSKTTELQQNVALQECETRRGVDFGFVFARVRMGSGKFSPPSFTIKLGTTVTWTNTEPSDGPAYTVTSGSNGQADGQFTSGPIAPGGTFQFTFTIPGSYPYFSTTAPANMAGEIIVTP